MESFLKDKALKLKYFKRHCLKGKDLTVGQQCSVASTWRCLGSLVVTTASDAKSTTYKKNRY
uniref:Uncharacterized protein n=1 Tax=Amphimedon queenslandica TaxID=400682 RepID=A0A1X7TRC0_AMPQE